VSQAAAAVSGPDKEARLWAMLEHLAALLAFTLPFGAIIGPLVIYLIKKDDDPFIARHGRAVLNFQISILLYFLLTWFGWVALWFASIATYVTHLPPMEIKDVLPPFVIPLLFLGALFIIVLFLFDIVMIVRGAVAASQGRQPHYWLAIPFLRA
jgi:uncharacterized protein